MKKLFVIKILALLLYQLSKLIPRKSTKWLFGEPHGFNNNSKYLYIEIIENHPEIDAIWIGDETTVSKLKKKGCNALSRYSLKGIWNCLIAKVYVVSWTQGDISFYLSGGAIIVNLWHGAGFKNCLWLEESSVKYENASIFEKIVHFVNRPILHFPPQIVLSTSPFYTENVFTKIFHVDKEQCVEDIYPRVKFMLKPRNEILLFLEKYSYIEQLNFIKGLSIFNKVYLYAPTFRDNNTDFVRSSGIDFHEINELMRKSNSLFIVKFHPATFYYKGNYEKLSNVCFLDNKYDLYSTMPFTDVLITDYSSIMADYLLLKKKIIAFLFDYEKFKNECRDFLFDYQSAIDGIPIAWDYHQLRDYIMTDIPNSPMNLIKRYWDPSHNLIDRIFESIDYEHNLSSM